jgi:CRISPR-associated protein Csx16
MTTHLVTRHPGALEWLLARGLTEIEHVPHLDPARVEPGDVVVGTLPVHLAAAVCERGARYFNLSLDVPESARGRELTAEELTCYGARLEGYAIQKLEDTPDKA